MQRPVIQTIPTIECCRDTLLLHLVDGGALLSNESGHYRRGIDGLLGRNEENTMAQWDFVVVSCRFQGFKCPLYLILFHYGR